MYKPIFFLVILFNLSYNGIESINLPKSLNEEVAKSPIMAIPILENYENETGPFEIPIPIRPSVSSPNKSARSKRENKFEEFRINGKDAEDNQFPYVVSLRSSSSGKHFCSGAIISVRHVLSAAHCFCSGKNFKESYEILVTTGRYSLSSDGGDQSSSPEKFKDILQNLQAGFLGTALLDIIKSSAGIYAVRNKFCYYGYEQSELKHDIGILSIFTVFHTHYDIRVRTIPMVIGHIFSESVAGNLSVKITGWNGKEGEVRKLQYIDTTTMSRDDCKNKLKEDKMDEKLWVRNFCTSEGSSDCSGTGDAGGPVVYEGNLLGIVSWSTCSGKAPVVHTSVPHYHDWIIDIIHFFY